jgi:type II secretory pathway pseudopilin PulG
MDCKITYTEKGRAAAAFTLIELMVATGLGTLMLAVMLTAVLYGARAFVAMDNYLVMDQKSEQALDYLSREIREADHLTAFASNNISFVDNTGTTVQYQYDSNSQTLDRISGGVTNKYLTGCDSLTFSIYQRTPMSNTFEPFSTISYTNAKLIEINWHCSQAIQSATANSESSQSAKVVIRNH